MVEPVISPRELNRAVLARQRLLERADLAIDVAVECAGALQAQYAPAPPVALWSRICDLTLEDYAAALREHRVVTGLLMRGTLHVVSAREYWPIVDALASVQDQSARSADQERSILADLRADLPARIATGPVSQADITAYLREWLIGHGHDPDDPEVARMGRGTWRVVRGSTALLSVQSRGAWGEAAPDAYVSAHAVLPPPPASPQEDGLTVLVRHYLRAFGPAAPEDIASWIGYLRPAQLRAALDALAPELVRFRDEAGRLLYDLAGAPRPTADVATPVRFLAWFDSLLLAYAPRFRARILPEQYRPVVIRTANLQVLATFLVDGMVAGTWDIEARRQLATLVVRPLERLARGARKAAVEEGERLVRFLRPAAGEHEVRVEDN